MTEDSTRDSNFKSFVNINENRSKLLAFILANVQDFDVSEDLFQETILEILKNGDKYDSSRPFLPWAYGISRNVVRRFWEREGRKPLTMRQEVLERLAQAAVDTDCELWREERTALQNCLEKLPVRLNKLFVLRYGYNLKGQKLADRVDFKVGSVRTTLARLRKRLRECITTQISQVY